MIYYVAKERGAEKTIMFDKESSDAMTKALYGKHAVHSSLNYIAQPVENSRFVAVAQSQIVEGMAHPLLFGNGTQDFPHLLVMGDLVFRPHLVVGSNHLIGTGISGLARSGFDMDEWVSNGTVLLHNK